MYVKKDKILTIVICCYNGGKYLKECLDSISKQSFSALPYQVLFIDDASTDNSVQILRSNFSILDNVTLINNKENNGVGNCCNMALGIINTPYFMRLDSDDYLSCDAIEKISEELSSSKDMGFIIFGRWDKRNDYLQEVNISDDIYTWIASATVFSTEAVKKSGGYCREYWEEYDLYIRLLEDGCKHKTSNCRIYYYRRGHASMTNDYNKNKAGIESLKRKWGNRILKKYGNYENILSYYGS